MKYWFLYNLSDGSIHGAPYKGDVDEWTNVPDGCGVLGPIDEADETATDARLNPTHYIVKDGNLAAVDNIAGLQLSEAQQAKLSEIQAAAAKALGMFTSSALGSAHTYLSGTNDMLLIEAEDRFMQGADWDGQNVLWYTVEAGDIEHTKAQIHQVYLDGRAAVQRKKYTAKNLVAQVQTATDTATVNAIDVTGADWN
jgi:hypothetical protein